MKAMKSMRSAAELAAAPKHHLRTLSNTSPGPARVSRVGTRLLRPSVVSTNYGRASLHSANTASTAASSASPTYAQIWQEKGWRGVLDRVVESNPFECFMCGVVIANSLSLGVEQSYRLQNRDPEIFQRLETIFLVIYICELALTFCAKGLQAFKSKWVCFEFVLVLVGSISDWIIIPNVGSSHFFSSLAVLRTVRLLRLARAVRLIVKLREIRVLALGLASSIAKMIPTLGLGGILLYVMGCVAVEIIPLAMRERGDLDAEVSEIIFDNFHSLPVTMLTLVQFATFDNPVLVYKPLVDEDGSLGIFFILALLILGVVFMNLITAAMVSRGLEQAMEEEIARSAVTEARRKGLLLDLENAFYQADTNNSGSLSREEVEAIDDQQKKLLLDGFGISSLLEFFDCLDTDGNGELGIDEFCHGLEGIVLSQIPLEVKHVERVVESISAVVRDGFIMQRRMARTIERIAAGLEDMTRQGLFEAPPEPGDRHARKESFGSSVPSILVRNAVRDPVLPTNSESPRIPNPQVPAALADLKAELRELRETCASKSRQVLEDACSNLMARLADGGGHLRQRASRTSEESAAAGICASGRFQSESSFAISVEEQVWSTVASGGKMSEVPCAPFGETDTSPPSVGPPAGGPVKAPFSAHASSRMSSKESNYGEVHSVQGNGPVLMHLGESPRDEEQGQRRSSRQSQTRPGSRQAR